MVSEGWENLCKNTQAADFVCESQFLIENVLSSLQIQLTQLHNVSTFCCTADKMDLKFVTVLLYYGIGR